jgi:starch synthase (maltosyl-transferring)
MPSRFAALLSFVDLVSRWRILNTVMPVIKHSPLPGQLEIRYRGDSLLFRIILDEPSPGTAWLRTNIGHARARRREIIRHVEGHEPIMSRDWHDLPMQKADASDTVFELEVPLAEVGRFEAKAFFLPEGEHEPVWPEGENVVIKVEPATSLCGNSLYTAFARQFGPNIGEHDSQPERQEAIRNLDEAGYAVIPRSGTLRRLIKELDHIIDTMGFRIIQLLPIHPVPTTYARMGRFGSPFASIDFFDVDPALAEFDRKTTPLDQFGELVDAIHARNARIFLDLPINHTGWASHLQMHHPEWFARSHDASFMSPGAWGVTWEDLSELDYSHRELWHYMANVFLFWCRHGVDGFRCDAGYMVPVPVWEYIVAKVREEYPETVFLLEGLGGKVSVTKALLDTANLNWAYSEIFQVYDRGHMEHYLPQSQSIARTHGTLVHFAETHDNTRLAAESVPYARMRTALAALFSEGGAFGITNGVEWFATARVDVHGAPPLNWGREENQIDVLSRINLLLAQHPAFRSGTHQRLVQQGNGNALALLRAPDDGSPVLVVANLDVEHAATVSWSSADFDVPNGDAEDLVSGLPRRIEQSGNLLQCNLDAAEVLCLAPPGGRDAVSPLAPATVPDAVLAQQRKATALSLYLHWTGRVSMTGTSVDALAQQLVADPVTFCEEATGAPFAQHVTNWKWPEDQQRTIMLPHGHSLLIRSGQPFRSELLHGSTRIDVQTSLASDDGDHFAFLHAAPTRTARDLELRLSVICNHICRHSVSRVLQLPPIGAAVVATRLDREALRDTGRYALLTNGCGAMSQVRLEWGTVLSQYDCLLGANLHDAVPVDRHIAFTRCRAWLVHRGYSQEITTDCIRHVSVDLDRSVTWTFDIPAGLGKSVCVRMTLQLAHGENRVQLAFERLNNHHTRRQLAATDAITLILRPDIESRNFHTTTKAYAGPETDWPGAVVTREDGFRFAPYPACEMDMHLNRGSFTHEPEWIYGVPHPFEQDRGLDDSGDLFSPGYFKITLFGGDATELTAAMAPGAPAPLASFPSPDHATAAARPLEEAMDRGMRAFIVKREDTRTVIAGYPWFLDWGRDTLICLRGIIAAGMHAEARDILVQFARFEDRGTLPNMIRGNDESNRDTSDAPLWFFTACADLLKAEGNDAFLDMDCRGRCVREILVSIASHYLSGTPNGISVDRDSGLVFSPSHYTWMDTNHPAGTPREGYPIEIQALWFAALTLLTRIDDADRWQPLADQVRSSIMTLYRLPDRGYLADCLLAPPGTRAAAATPDNALRPNQLLAITLGAIDDHELAKGILLATERLLIPGAIRSLADQSVHPPLPVYRDGQLLNDPDRPYWGNYSGDEDTRRKAAYHNGTAWTWPFPSYCEALYMVGGPDLRETALSLLGSGAVLANDGCVGHIPEILDGNTPHRQRGCGAQAWGETELYRVLKQLAWLANRRQAAASTACD